jgi:hypothetical protein
VLTRVASAVPKFFLCETEAYGHQPPLGIWLDPYEWAFTGDRNLSHTQYERCLESNMNDVSNRRRHSRLGSSPRQHPYTSAAALGSPLIRYPLVNGLASDQQLWMQHRWVRKPALATASNEPGRLSGAVPSVEPPLR